MASFTYLDEEKPSAGFTYLDDAPPKQKQNTGIVGDIGTALKRGVLQMPGMATGLADIAAAPVSIATGINRPVSRAADWIGEQTGFQPGKWAEAAGAEYSPEMQQAQQNVEQAKGFFPTLGAVAQNPRVAAQVVAESLPSTIAGGLVARGAMGAVAGAEKLAALRTAAGSADAAVANAARRELLKSGAIAAGVGEGAVTAGQQMAQTGYDVDPALAAGAALGAGVGTGIIGGLSGRFAGSALGRKLGLSDIETSMAAGTFGENAGKAGAAGFARRIGAGAIQEGLLEEAPQSYQEQVWQNLAAGKPLTEGAAEAAALGTVAGGVMGAGFNIASGPLSKAVAAAPGAAVPPAGPAGILTGTPAGNMPVTGTPAGTPAGNLGIASAAQFPQFTAPPQPVTGGAPLEQAPTAMPVPQATQNAPAAPGSPSPVSAADTPLPAKQAEAAGAPIQPPQGPLPSADQAEIAIPPAQGPEAAALPVAAKPANGIAAALQYPQQVTEGGGPLAQQAADMPLGRFGETVKKPEYSAGSSGKWVLRRPDSGRLIRDAISGNTRFFESEKEAQEYAKSIALNDKAATFSNRLPKAPRPEMAETAEKKPAISPDISPDIPAKKATRIASSSGIAGALVTPQQPTFGGAPLEQTPTEMPLGKYGNQKASEPAATQQVPPRIRSVVAIAIDRLRSISDSLDNVVAARGNGAILAGELAGRQEEISKAKAKLDQFRTLAAQKGIDAEAVIKELGGEPDFAKFAPRQTPPDAPQQPLSSANAPQARRQPQPPPIMRRDDLVGAIMRVTGGDGINSNMALTIAGDTAGRGLSKLRGLFTNRGTIDLGEVATRLREDEGFDVRDGEHLSELIRAASFGDTAVSMERAERDQDTAEEKRHRDYIRQNAKKLKIKSVAVKFSDLEKQVIAALTRRHERAIELLDERAKKRFDAALEESYALMSEDVVDAVLVDMNGRGLRPREFWNQATTTLRYMLEDAKAKQQQEALDAIEGAEPDWLKDDDGRGNQPVGGGGEADRVAQEASGDAEFNLAAQTPEEIAPIAQEQSEEDRRLAAIRQMSRAYWHDVARPRMIEYLNAYDAFGKERMERNRVKPEGLDALGWLKKVSSQEPTWDRGRKIGLTGIQMLSQKDLWPTGDSKGERLRKSMLAAVRAYKNSPSWTGNMEQEVFGVPQDDKENSPSIDLVGQTPEEIAAAEAAAKEAKQAEAAAAAAEARKEKAAQDKAEKDRRAAEVLKEREAAKKAEVDKAAEEFALGQAAPEPVVKKVTTEDARGQKDIFAAPADKPNPDQAAIDKANADFDDALNDLGDIIGKPFRANFTPEQEQKLIPVLTRLMDAAFRKGYYKFKEAARFVLESIGAKFGKDLADQITLQHLQGAYVGMSGRYLNDGADSIADVASIKARGELLGSTNAGVKPKSAQVNDNGGVTDTKSPANIAASQSERVERNSVGDIEALRGMYRLMVRAAKNKQILNSIVDLIPVDVMNMLGGQQLTPDALFNNPSMLENLAGLGGNPPIPGGVNAARSVVEATARFAAKSAWAKEFGSDSIDFDAALNTIKSRHGVTPNSDVSLGDAPALTGATPTIIQKGLANVTNERSGANLERDSQDANIADGVGAQVVPVGAGGNGGAGRPGVAGSGAEGNQPAGGNGLRDGEAAIAGERGNLEVHTGATKLSPGSAGNSVDLGGDSVGVGGLPIEPDAAGRIKEAARGGIQLEVAKAKQRAADKAPFVKGLEAIRRSLPILTEGQQEDVFKTETRFAVPDGYGMLFTNGTGTGKTFSALGVIKRFASQGKQNILVVAPSQEIISAWQKAGKLLGLDLSLLEDINDAGSGMVITTYANMGANNKLAGRDWDLIVHDEAHYLSMNKDGTNTESLNALRAISLHPDGAFKRAIMLHGDIRDAASIAQKQADIAARSDDARDWPMAKVHQARANKLNAEFNAKHDAIKADVAARQLAKRPRVMFLSATPFAYEKSVDWANGYLFDYNEGRGDERNEFRGYNAGSNSDQFMMQHFGYRMRYGKLTAPDAKVDSGLMQRQFNSWLKKSGSLSGRMLDVDADYDRRFILVDSAIGQRIDEALQWFDTQRKATNDKDRQAAISAVQEFISEKFDYLSRRYLLESIKAKEVVPHVREHLAMGRKVVVFHDYKKGGGFNPFIIGERTVKDQDSKEAATSAAEWNGVVGAFNAEFKDIINSDLFKQTSPILMFKNEFPGVLLFNGDVSVKERRANVQRFQDDASGPQVILVQSAAGKEGISLHDTTGKHQRVLFNLGQPTQPTTAIQQEGRIYRTGQVTDAIFRYLNTGTNWEKWAFATTIANRASAAENLGMGELARSLKDAFIAGFEESDNYRAGMDGEGKGGKERDKAANNALTEYDRARAFYFGTQKKNGRTKAQEGADYFATPEPVGLKMVEWANVRPGEKVLEPSAGHGAIARWMPATAERTAVEPSMTLRPRLAMVFDGQIIDSDFESLNVVNKYDAIVMNPPFGSGGKTAIDHLAKAATHLRDGGRIVALLPTGPAADKKFEKWFYEESTKPLKPLTTYTIDGKATPIYKGDTIESKATWAPSGVVTRVLGAVGNNEPDIMVKATAPEFRGAETRMSAAQIKMIQPTGKRETTFKAADGLNLVADIKLPQVTFERAGTAVSTRIVVIEKSANSPQQTNRDFSDAADINTLFDRLENMALPDRAKEPEPEAAAAPAKKEKAPPAKVGDSVTVNGNQYAIEIYTTNDGKDKRGIWMEEKEAKAINPRAFKSSKMRGTPAEGKFFVDEYWLNKRAPDSSSRFSFAGQQSATADQFQLDRAKQLLADGANANAVRQQTGWFKNPSDGKWRYEIDDSGASLKAHGFGFGELLEAIGKNLTLAEVLDHPALFAAYPSIAGSSVEAIDEKSQNNGELVTNKDGGFTIRVNAGLGEAKALSVMLHEIQHGIQNVEGFASGGSPSQFGPAQQVFESQSAADEYVRKLPNPFDARIVKDFRTGKIKVVVQGQTDPYQQYKKLAGEVESRNVQQRQNFPADKRKYSDPLGTQDVAPEDVIVMFNGKEAKDAPAPFNTTRASAMAAVGASPADAAVFDMAAEGRSAQEILAFLSKASRRPFNRTLAGALMRIGVSSTVSVDPAAGWRNNMGRNGAKFAASYSPKTDTVSLYTPRESERHALHEFVHSATLKAIARGGPAARQMQAVFDHVQKTGTMSDQYGMGNFARFKNETDAQFKKRMLDEFTAELFTNPQFQLRLKQLPAPSGSKLKSAWDWIVRVIANLLGLKTKAQETALDRALSVGAALLQENAALTMPKGETARYHTTWHGSPHKFYTFDLSKIGTGEGAQAYGHGLYVAEAPEVAKSYSGKLSSELKYNGRKVDRNSSRNSIDSAAWALYLAEGNKEAAKMSGLAKPELIDALDPTKLTPGGQVYKVDLPAEAVARMLDWDAGLHDNPMAVKIALEKDGWDTSAPDFDMDIDVMTGEDVIRELFDQLGSKQAVSDRLLSMGIVGTRYLDKDSRDKGKGTSNFVLFDDKLARIIEVNGVETGVQPWQPGEWEATQGGERFSQEQPFSGMEVAGFSSFEAIASKDGTINFYGTAKVSGQTYFAKIKLHPNGDGTFKTGLTDSSFETHTGKPVKGSANIKLEQLLDVAKESALSWANEYHREKITNETGSEKKAPDRQATTRGKATVPLVVGSGYSSEKTGGSDSSLLEVSATESSEAITKKPAQNPVLRNTSNVHGQVVGPFSGREVAATPLKPGNGFTAKQLGEIRDLSRKIEQQARFNAERAKSLPEGHKLRATGIRALAALQERYATAVAARAGFDAWFGKSKAVGPEGDPLVLYHGTTRDITAFKRKDGGRAIWAADSLTANSYAGESSGSNVLPVFMSIQNPLVVDAGGASFRDLMFENQRLDADELSDIAEERGYDGLIIRDLRDHDTDDGGDYPADHYAVFSPNQIKSAVSNTGAFSAEDPDIRYSLATNWQQSPVAPGNLYQAAKKKAASLLTPERLDKVIYETQDKFIDLRRIRDHIKEIGGTITDLNDAYLGEELYHKRLAYRTEQFLKEELRPFFADMKARGVEMPEFEKFLHARHAPEANAEMARRNPNQKQVDAGRQKSAATVRALELNLQTAKARGLATVAIEKALTDAQAELVRWNGAQAFKGTEAERLSLSGMSNAAASALMASLTPAQRADMNALAAKVDAINEGTLQTLERYGLMDKAALNTWRKTYQHYVPLHRDEAHPDSASHPIGQGFNVRGDASKRRTGSNQEVTNIFSHIAMQREAALTRGEKNRVMQKLYLMARQNPIPEIWSVGKVPMIDTIDKATGFVRSVPDPQYKDKPNVITLRIGGKDVAIVMNEYNPQALRLAQSIKNLDVDDLHYLIPIVGKATRWFASINTQYNPIFGLINFARDVQTAALNLSTTEIAGKQKEVFKDTMSILGDIIKNKGRMPTAGKWAPIYKEFNEVGGTTGYRDLFLTAEDRSKAVTDEIKALDRGKVSQAAHAVAGWLSDYNEAMENATRLAAYKAAIDNGMSKERAASLAKNLTVNFNRKGRQTRELGALYAFFNAAVQGTARMAQTLSGPAGKKIMLGGVLAGAASAMAGIAAMGGGDGEDDEWSKIPEFVKERSFIIPAGKDKYIAIPMPLGFHFLPNIGRLMVEMAVYKDKTLGKQMASLFTVLADAFNPLGGSAPPMQIIAPTVMDPFIALAQNKDWTGKPIYVENFNSLNPQPGAARAKDSATPIAKGMADIINSVTGGTKYVPGAWSPTPDQIDYVIGQLTGGVGRELGKLSSTIAAPFTGDELPAHKIPLLGRLYGSTAGATGQAGKFYENIKRANEVENELKGRRKDGISVEDYLQDNPKAVELAARGNAAERQIRALRQMRSRIVEAGGVDAASKARQINERMATVMRGFNMQVERMQ